MRTSLPRRRAPFHPILSALLGLVSALAFSQPAAAEAAAPLRLAPGLSAHAVLKADAPLIVRGDAGAGALVTVRLDARPPQRARADASGHFAVTLPPSPAGGPHQLTVSAGGAETTLDDIHFGEVWLCSGQSNMEFPLARALNPDTELASFAGLPIRLLHIPQTHSVTAAKTLPDGVQWRPADASTLPGFSAVCALFGRERAQASGGPVGLIGASWGGSQIEAWLSPAALAAFPAYADDLRLLVLYGADPAAAAARFGASWTADWLAKSGGDAIWDQPAADGFRPVPMPWRDWQTYDDDRLQGHLGMVWFRTAVTLDPESAATPATLALGGVDELDAVFVNGRFIGSTFGWGTPRVYALPPGTLRAGANDILVNVYNGWGPGGMTGPEAAMQLRLGDARAPLPGASWQYRPEPAAFGAPVRAPWETISGLTGLHQAMIAPLSGTPLSGAVFYQGESNTGRAGAYAPLLTALITDWRRHFGAELPVVVVQLTAFGALAADAGPSGWAALREAQRRVAVADRRVGLAVTLDAGDPSDIHPANKQIVAGRVATVAAALLDAKGPPANIDGGAAQAAQWQDGAVRVTFAPGATPRLHSHHRPVGFQICDAAGACTFADAARAADGAILVTAAPTTARVHYCWADVPFCNMLQPNGAPVSPFSLAVEPSPAR